MEDILVKDDINIEDIYECKNGTKSINLAVKRHINRFPKRFMFQLTDDEFVNLKSQLGTSSWNSYGGIRKLPYAFTEQGVAMLATVLRTSVAEEMSIKIMDSFLKMRHYLLNSIGDNKYINEMLLKHDNEITEHGNSIKLL